MRSRVIIRELPEIKHRNRELPEIIALRCLIRVPPKAPIEREIIPGLPEIIALQCLIRVPPKAISALKGVSRRWYQLISSGEFFQERERSGITSELLCLAEVLMDGLKTYSTLTIHSHFRWYLLYDIENRDIFRLPPLPDDDKFPSCGVVRRGRKQKVRHVCGRKQKVRPDKFPACGVVRCGRKLYFLCGRIDPYSNSWSSQEDEKFSTKVYAFDFASGRWNRCADLLDMLDLEDYAAGVMEGRIYLRSKRCFGDGYRDRSTKEWAQVYESKDEWTRLPDPQPANFRKQGIIWNNKFLVFHNDVGSASSVQGECYDPETCTWNLMNNLKFEAKGDFEANVRLEEWSRLTFVVSKGKLYAISDQGRYCTSDNRDLTLRLWNFVEESSSWILLGTLAEHQKRVRMISALPLSDGDVLLILHLETDTVFKWRMWRLRITVGEGNNVTWSYEEIELGTEGPPAYRLKSYAIINY